MAGFDPVGSTPVAAIGTSSASGVSYSPGTFTLTFQGLPPVVVYSFLPSQVSGFYSEVLNSGLPLVQVNNLYAEILNPGAPVVQVNGFYAEVLRSLTSLAAEEGGGVIIIW